MAATPGEIPMPARAPLASMLRKLANKARGINSTFGGNPERQLTDKYDLAADIDKLAELIERGVG